MSKIVGGYLDLNESFKQVFGNLVNLNEAQNFDFAFITKALNNKKILFSLDDFRTSAKIIDLEDLEDSCKLYIKYNNNTIIVESLTIEEIKILIKKKKVTFKDYISPDTATIKLV